jgi:hypothetical protein
MGTICGAVPEAGRAPPRTLRSICFRGLLAGSAPGANAGGAEVIAFYTDHRARERAGAIVLGFAFVAFLFFAASLRARWRKHPRAEALSALLGWISILLGVLWIAARGDRVRPPGLVDRHRRARLPAERGRNRSDTLTAHTG